MSSLLPDEATLAENWLDRFVHVDDEPPDEAPLFEHQHSAGCRCTLRGE